MKPVPPPDALLCEACGYPLPKLQACPECGTPAAASDPAKRTGPPWARGMSLRAFAATAAGLLRGPRRFYAALEPAGPGLPPRLYLLAWATSVGAGWALAERLWIGREPVLAWGFGMLAGQAVVALTYLEVIGVTLFSRFRGWRVPAPLAEKVACYAAPAWVAGAAVAVIVERVASGGGLGRALARLTGDPLLGVRLTAVALPLAAILAVLPYESLVHRGVRAVRFANRRPAPPPFLPGENQDDRKPPWRRSPVEQDRR